MKQEKSAGAIVYRKEKEPMFLLLHYEMGHWDFPKGNIEANEKDLETVKREIQEETGIKDIEFLKDFKEKIQYYYKLKDEIINTKSIYSLRRFEQYGVNKTMFNWIKFMAYFLLNSGTKSNKMGYIFGEYT